MFKPQTRIDLPSTHLANATLSLNIYLEKRRCCRNLLCIGAQHISLKNYGQHPTTLTKTLIHSPTHRTMPSCENLENATTYLEKCMMGLQKFFTAFRHRIDAQETIDWHTKFHNSSKISKLAFLPHAEPCALVKKPTRCDVLTSLFRIQFRLSQVYDSIESLKLKDANM